MFKQKTAIVTGAGQGIGFEISRQLAKQGASVLLNDIDASLTEKAVKQINKDGGTCIGLSGDSADLAFIQSMVDKAVSHFGKLDMVVANAWITLFGNFLEYPPDSFHKVLFC